MLSKDNVMQVTNSVGVTFNVRLVFQGDRYGRNGCIVHEEYEPLIEFYDTRYDFEELGQFVSRYYLTTLLEEDYDEYSRGLWLNTGSDNWFVDGGKMKEVLEWAVSKFKKL